VLRLLLIEPEVCVYGSIFDNLGLAQARNLERITGEFNLVVDDDAIFVRTD